MNKKRMIACTLAIIISGLLRNTILANAAYGSWAWTDYAAAQEITEMDDNNDNNENSTEQTDVYKNVYEHYAWGFINGEGNNGTKEAFLLQTTYGEEEYGAQFSPNASYALTVPNGFYLQNKFGTSQITGTYALFNFGLIITQPAYVMNFEYNYYPIEYTITYNLDGGTNNSENPDTYTILYGVELKEPTREGYDFAGWYDADGNEVTGINEGCIAAFADTMDLYNSLSKRSTGNVEVTAMWETHTYKNTYKHYAWGFPEDDYLLQTTYSEETYGSTFAPDADYAVTIPNGFYLQNQFGTEQITDTYELYDFGTEITQPAYEMVFEYDYYPIEYTITFDLNYELEEDEDSAEEDEYEEDEDSTSNTDTYNVLYGVTFEEPTRTGYDFVGWYDENGNKITGINEGCDATFDSAEDLYNKLADRTTGNITVTAEWEIHEYKIETSQTGSGVISGSMDILYSNDTSVFMIPSEGYELTELKIDNISVSPVENYNFINVESDHTVEATFSMTQTYKMQLLLQAYSWIDLKLG